MIDKLLKINDGGTAVSESGVSDYVLDLNAFTDAYGTANTMQLLNDAGYLNIICPTIGTGATTNTMAVEFRTSASDATLNTTYDTFTIKAATAGTSYTAGLVLYSGTPPIPLKRYVGLYFTEANTATIFVDAWIGNPLTVNK